jgi:hypothetical protein
VDGFGVVFVIENSQHIKEGIFIWPQQMSYLIDFFLGRPGWLLWATLCSGSFLRRNRRRKGTKPAASMARVWLM